jgi:ubiquinone biosynthesis protein
MIKVVSVKAPGPPNRAKQRLKTWKFAGKFLWKNATTPNKRELGRWTRDELIKLGATYIKLGQIVSTRSDIYPPELCEELTLLQDACPPDPVDYSMLPRGLSYFETKPFKSASIGQVHRATLSDGRDCVIKIKRRYIEDILRMDTHNIKDIVNFLERVGVDTGTGNGYVLDESIANLIGESDYVKEVHNGMAFKENFKNVPWVKVPEMYTEYCSKDVIVMEYVPSQKLNEIDDPHVNRKKLVEAMTRAYVKMTMEDGLFHGDPHPGNLGFNGEALVFYDFGLMVTIEKELMDGCLEILSHILKKDTKKIVETLIRLRIIIPTADQADIEIFLEAILQYLESVDIKNLTDTILQDDILLELAETKPFLLPSNFIYLAKAFTLVEGQAKQLDEDFNYYTYLEPILKDKIKDVVDVKSYVSTAAQMPTTIANISTAVAGLERSRSAMKRQIDRARREVRFAQYSILCAMVAVEQDNKMLFTLFALGAVYFTFAYRKNR